MDTLTRFFSKNFFNPLISFLERVLPVSPFRAFLESADSGLNGFLSAINYFIPIGTFIAISEVWVTAMFLYYLYHGLVHRIWTSSDKDKAGLIKKILDFIKKFLPFLKK